MNKTVDSFHFVRGVTKRMVKTWIKQEPPREIPWTPLRRPLAECRVAMLSSAAIALKSDRPFDQDGERKNPWWGDPSYRVIPHGTRAEDIRIYHLHINPAFGEEDINCVLPVDRLEELKNEGLIGSISPVHFSYMGYMLQPDEFLHTSLPRIISHLHREEVDVVLLVPV